MAVLLICLVDKCTGEPSERCPKCGVNCRSSALQVGVHRQSGALQVGVHCQNCAMHVGMKCQSGALHVGWRWDGEPGYPPDISIRDGHEKQISIERQLSSPSKLGHTEVAGSIRVQVGLGKNQQIAYCGFCATVWLSSIS